jgi:hypothetical protein
LHDNAPDDSALEQRVPLDREIDALRLEEWNRDVPGPLADPDVVD